MFKFLRRKLFEKMIGDFIEDMPKYKESALLLFLEKKGELIEKIEKAVLEAITKFFEEKLR